MATPTSQCDIHPLLRHPRPIKRDSAKAQRMLGLIVDSEDKFVGLQREKSKTTKWLERPFYEYLDASDVDSDKEGYSEEEANKHIKESETHLGGYHRRSPPICQRQHLNPNSGAPTKTTLRSRRPHPIAIPRCNSSISYHHIAPQYALSPGDISSGAQHERNPLLQSVESQTCDYSSSCNDTATLLLPFRHSHKSSTYPPPLNDALKERPVSFQENPSTGGYFTLEINQSATQRPRPTSFAIYNQRDRRNSKIASSRGFRTNSYPNFSRPISSFSPRLVPGEHIENDCVHERPEKGQTIPLSSCHNQNMHIVPTSISNEDGSNTKSKNRWSTIPQTFKRLTKRSSMATTQGNQPNIRSPDVELDSSLDQIPSLDNAAANEVQSVIDKSPKHFNLLPTPTYSPLRIDHPLYKTPLPAPFAPWADTPPSPAVTIERDQARSPGRCPEKRTASPRQSVASVASKRPSSLYSKRSSFVMPSPTLHPVHFQDFGDSTTSLRVLSRKNTPSIEQSCVICKLGKYPSDMVDRRMTPNCWHEPATCLQCLRLWLENGIKTQGPNNCACPECGETMTAEDVETFITT